MHTTTLAYQADGLAMQGHFASDPQATGLRPGVLVFPEAFGLGAHARQRAERLAGLGYIALAGDLHGNQYNAGDLDEALGLLAPLRAAPSRIRARAAGALQALLAQPGVDPDRIGAIGYCFGGTMALELARSGAPMFTPPPASTAAWPPNRLTTPANITRQVSSSVSARTTPAIDRRRNAPPSKREMKQPAMSTGSSASTATPSTASPTRTRTQTRPPGLRRLQPSRPTNAPGPKCSRCSDEAFGASQ